MCCRTQLLLKAAVQLNNTSCHLLRCGCYQQGYETLSDALHIIRELVHDDDFIMVDSGMVTPCVDIQATTRAADQRLSRSHPEATTEIALSRNSSPSPVIEVVADDEWLSTIYFPAVEPSIVRVIRLEPPPDAILLKIEHVSVEIAAIFCNLSIAYQCSRGGGSVSEADARARRNCQNAALHLLSFGHATVSTGSSDQFLLEDESSRGYRSLIVTAILLHQVVQDIHGLGDLRLDELLEYCCHARFVHDEATRERDMLGALMERPAAAA